MLVNLIFAWQPVPQGPGCPLKQAERLAGLLWAPSPQPAQEGAREGVRPSVQRQAVWGAVPEGEDPAGL